MIDTPILRADRVTKSYERRDGILPVLTNVDLEVAPGEIVAVFGASGAGKSTLLHILGSLDDPTSGRVEIGGIDPSSCSKHDLNRLRNLTLGFVFQFHYLMNDFDALENVSMPAFIAGNNGEAVRDRALELLRSVGLEDRRSHVPSELSGGEQQRVAVARALVNSPALVLADEPSGNLDEENSRELHRIMCELSKEKGQTFVVVTHKREFCSLADRVLVLENGELFERMP